MLVHPWDAPLDDAEWREWLGGNDFGQLIAPGRDREVPVVVPTHFRYDGATTVELHLAKPNPVWAAIDERPTVLLTVIGDYVFVPSTWGAAPGTPPELGIATSYYATVQLTCTATIVDDDAEKAALLRRQLGLFQPEGGYADVTPDLDHYARRLPQIRGLRLDVTAVRAKFKYGGNKEVDHRAVVADRLAAARAHLLRRSGLDEAPTLQSVVIHGRDPVALARFWTVATGLPPADADAAYVTGDAPLPDGESILLTPGEGGPRMWLSRAERLDPPGNRVHLDVRLRDEAHLAELLAAGGSVVREEKDWTVLTDPEGNELCALRPTAGNG